MITFLPGLESDYRNEINCVLEISQYSALIGCDPPCGAVVCSSKGGAVYGAAGNVDSHPALTALADARLAGLNNDIVLVVTVPDSNSKDVLPEEVLEALNDFGTTTVVLVAPDRSVAIATVSNTEAA